MYEASVILDMPLDGAAVSGIGMSLNTSDFAVYFRGRLDEVTLIISDTSRGAIIKHERPGVRVELSPWRCFGNTVSPCHSHGGNGIVVEAFLRDFSAPASSGSHASKPSSVVFVVHFHCVDRFEEGL